MVTEKEFTQKYTEVQKKVSKIEVPPPTPSGKNEKGEPVFIEPKDFESGMDKFAEETSKLVAPVIYKFTEEKSIEIAQKISVDNDAPIMERLNKLIQDFQTLKEENEQLKIRVNDLETVLGNI